YSYPFSSDCTSVQTVFSIPVGKQNRHSVVAKDNMRCLTCVTWNFHDVTFLPYVQHQLPQPVPASCLRLLPAQSHWIRPTNPSVMAQLMISRQSNSIRIISWAAPLERGY